MHRNNVTAVLTNVALGTVIYILTTVAMMLQSGELALPQGWNQLAPLTTGTLTTLVALLSPYYKPPQ
tara:strand:+ start:274 stop:474 length:201 start_codon:yes stop_codon:yes gene_type:complete